MISISILYFSGTGHTRKLAEAVALGAASIPGVTPHLLAIDGNDILKGRYTNPDLFAKLDTSDAIIFGTPTYMGGPAAQFKAFADATGDRWYKGAWRDKIAAGFTVSGAPSGDKLSTIHYLFTLAMQHAMIWVGIAETAANPQGINRLGSHSGVMAQAGQESPELAPNAADKLTGEVLGKRVAELALRLKK